MNTARSFDTVLQAIVLIGMFQVMALAIILCGILMVAMAAHAARLVQCNRLYEVFGLFVLLPVCIMLMSEGGHLVHPALFGYEITTLRNAPFNFVPVTPVLADAVQGRRQRKITADTAAKSGRLPAAAL
ncbi:MAG: hypothetical protein AAFW74_01925 [Pseudomonadota bacterium]